MTCQLTASTIGYISTVSVSMPEKYETKEMA